MSAPVGPERRDGLYSKLIEEDGGAYENFTASPRLAVAQRPSPRPAPGPSPGLGLGPGLSPRLYRASTAALAVLCVVLLICVIAVSTHKQKPSSEEASPLPQTQQQKQDFNVSELHSQITRLQEENRRLWEKINSTKVEAPPPPPECPSDWLIFNHSCYFVNQRSRSWSDSHEYCVGQGGHLAIITTAEEQTFVWEQLPRGHWNAFWIGITDSHTEDHWTWVDGTELVGGFWEEGEPNNHINEDCGYIVKTEVLERVAVRSWYDAPCSMYWPFVCESPGRSATPTAQSG